MLSCFWDFITDNPAIAELIVTIIFGAVAAWFSWLAYCHSKEKFRLELLDKRWPIYEQLTNVHNKLKIAGLYHDAQPSDRTDIAALLRAAYNELERINLCQLEALFGEDVRYTLDNILNRMEKICVYTGEKDVDTCISDQKDEIKSLLEQLESLPSVFKLYMDFSSYKKS